MHGEQIGAEAGVARPERPPPPTLAIHPSQPPAMLALRPPLVPVGGLLALLVATSGCLREMDELEPAPFPAEPAVFHDRYGPDVGWQSFGDGANPHAQGIEHEEVFRGSAAVRLSVPSAGDPSGSWAGGVFATDMPRDLTGFDALTFWAKASTAAAVNTIGIGNDNTGSSLYTATTDSIPISTSWTRYTFPIPLPAKLSQEPGLFLVSEASEYETGYELYMDDIQFERTGRVANPRPSIPSRDLFAETGDRLELGSTQVTFEVDGRDMTIHTSPHYFDFTSSDGSVAAVGEDGGVTAVGEGTATVTATLGPNRASGSLSLRVFDPPAEGPPDPVVPPADVISLFSGAYDDVPVETWSAEWDQADVTDVTIAGNAAKKYTNLVYAGIEFTSPTVNATPTTRIHLDLWTLDASEFRLKLVDFGTDGTFGGGDDSEHEITLNEGSDPPIGTAEWNSLDIPLAAFPGLAGVTNLAQIIVSGTSPIIYLDNLFLYAPAPETPAPAPVRPADAVVSLFSDAYDDISVDTWSADWDQADVEEVDIQGDAVKKYRNLVFAGIEFISEQIDATDLTHLHFDLWTPHVTAAPAAFRVKLVDFGADGAFGGGDDSEHEITLSAASDPPLASESWTGYDIALGDFAGLAARSHLSQLIISGDLNTVYLDNIYFFAPTPEERAPVPEHHADDVISLFSDAYDDVAVDTWSAGWDVADVEDVEVEGDATKKYTNLVFAGIEFTSETIDATGMTHFSFDMWTPDPTLDAAFKVKLVDFGPDGAWSGGDDSEHEITITRASDPALVSGEWISYEIPFEDFTGLAAREHLAQLIIAGDPNTVYLDNIYFWGLTEPREAAPTPDDAEDDVISLFSDAYDDVKVDTWSAPWDQADVEDVEIEGNATKKYTNLVFAGIEFTSETIDATEMTHFRFDFWTPDPTLTAAFKVKLVDFGEDGQWSGGDDSEHEITIDRAYDPPLVSGEWISFDIPLSEFTGLEDQAHLAQLIISGDPNTVFLDNVYLRR